MFSKALEMRNTVCPPFWQWNLVP